MSEAIPIIGGTGDLGFGLAVRWARAGREVVIGSRDADRAAEAAQRVEAVVPGAAVSGRDNSNAVDAGSVVFLTVPFGAQADTLKSLAQSLQPGQLVVDCTVPLATAIGGKPTCVLGVWHGSAAEQAKELVPDGVTAISALHTVSASALAGDAELEEDVLICGDRKTDKAKVAELVQSIAGLRAINAGSLETSRIIETLTPILISINTRYKTHAGIHITGLPNGDHWA